MVTEIELLHFARETLLVASVGGSFYLVLAALLLSTLQVRREAARYSATPVTILIPMCGFERGLDIRLRALCRQDYPGPLQIICGFRSPNDPAIDEVRAVAGEQRGVRIDLAINARIHGRNLKVSNLINMLCYARHETLIAIDSDIKVGPSFISEVVGELQKPGVGAVTSLYRCLAGDDTWSHLAALAGNAYFLPDVILALRLHLARPCFGASIAISRKTLLEIGGFVAFADCLWEDYAIGEAVRRLGMDVILAPSLVDHVCLARGGQDLFAQELRAALTAQAITPIGQFGRVIVFPFQLAAIAVVLGGGAPAAAIAILGLMTRFLVNACFARCFCTEPAYGRLLVTEFVVFTAYLASWLCSTVVWRGQNYKLVSEMPATDFR